MTQYQKFLKGNISKFTWVFRMGLKSRKKSDHGFQRYLLYTWRISEYNNIYYIFISEYGPIYRSELHGVDSILRSDKKFGYYVIGTTSKYINIIGKPLKNKIIRKYKINTLIKFLKKPYKYVT